MYILIIFTLFFLYAFFNTYVREPDKRTQTSVYNIGPPQIVPPNKTRHDVFRNRTPINYPKVAWFNSWVYDDYYNDKVPYFI